MSACAGLRGNWARAAGLTPQQISSLQPQQLQQLLNLPPHAPQPRPPPPFSQYGNAPDLQPPAPRPSFAPPPPQRPGPLPSLQQQQAAQLYAAQAAQQAQQTQQAQAQAQAQQQQQAARGAGAACASLPAAGCQPVHASAFRLLVLQSLQAALYAGFLLVVTSCI